MLVFPIVPFCIRDAIRPDVAAEIGWLTGQGIYWKEFHLRVMYQPGIW
tara:strand:- start:351 stop:494 length:144 start_codon:yes stop_codon:yes gene_type:complete